MNQLEELELLDKICSILWLLVLITPILEIMCYIMLQA